MNWWKLLPNPSSTICKSLALIDGDITATSEHTRNQEDFVAVRGTKRRLIESRILFGALSLRERHETDEEIELQTKISRLKLHLLETYSLQNFFFPRKYMQQGKLPTWCHYPHPCPSVTVLAPGLLCPINR